MTTENQHTARTPGPLRVEIEVLTGTVTVATSPDVERATVTVHTADDHGAFADVVTGTRFLEHGRTLKVRIPNTGAGEAHFAAPHTGTTVHNYFRGNLGGGLIQGATVVQAGRTTVRRAAGVRDIVFTQNGTDSFQMLGGVEGAVFSQSGLGKVQMDDGTLSVNGVVIVRNGVVAVPEGTRVDSAPGTVRVDIQLPPGSDVVFSSSGEASLTLDGELRRVEAVLADGALSAARADIGIAKVSTITGDISLGNTRDSAVLNTDTGDIKIRRFGGGELTATSTSGDIKVRTPDGVNRPATVTLNTVSGHIHTRGLARLPHLRLTANSRTGDVQHRI
ncbi:DUF4097 family beta strand repeat-containing protein [Kitasatospora sp. NPDC001547]|uniref:DUF4097 family beta strand repeat-containing protein n=1 Tax=Kitasatospora sp. NPDC001547 TaxID=3364015 RepID=UPI00368F5151